MTALASPDVPRSTRKLWPRRTEADIERVKDAIMAVAEEEHPVTLRRIFYVLRTAAVVENTDNEYKKCVSRLSLEMRREGRLPYDWIRDGMRETWQRSSWASVEHFAQWVRDSYRRNIWADQEPVHVEVWVEKDALADILYEVTGPLDVPLQPFRGDVGDSWLHGLTDELPRDRPVFVYYLGDFDPSGKNMDEVTLSKVREFAPDVDFTFTRLAVTPEQIRKWELPSEPVKEKDTKAADWEGGCVELDAISAKRLQGVVRDAIMAHVDLGTLEQTRATEAEEQALIAQLKLPRRRPS
jgi:hypothetical protein